MLVRDTPLGDALWLDFDYSEPLFSNKKIEVIANNLGARIDDFVSGNAEEIGEIILAGHSMGTVILRRAFLDAQGYGSPGAIRQSWPSLVGRIVLLAAFGRGFDPKKQPLGRQVWLRPLAFLGRSFGFGKMRLELFTGSDSIARLRVDWIKFNGTCEVRPKIVHLLGTLDIVTYPEDVIDLEQFPNTIAIAVPNAEHGNIAIPRPDTVGPLKRAFVGDPKSDRPLSIPEDAPDKIFFLLHGIRDSRECFKAVASELDERIPSAKVILPDYGYLSARSFLSARYRDSFVRWFIDKVSEYLARNPRAEFFFAGHSNGTYILGEALKRIPRFSFSRIYLAASVLPREFEWDTIIDERKQTSFVRCDMGTEDWPVGVLCRTLNRFGMESIGPGGFDGFEYGDRDHIAFNHFGGGHGAMLTASNKDSIVDFLLTGSPGEIADTVDQRPSMAFTLFRKGGDILLPLILAVGLALIVLVAIFAPYGIIWAALMAWLAWLVAGRL